MAAGIPHPRTLFASIVTALVWVAAVAPGAAARPDGTLTVAVATFGNERWLPHLYPGAEDVAALNLFMEHPKLDEVIDRLATQPSYAERVQIMRDQLGPWLYEYIPGVAIGAAHNITAVGPKVGDWPLIPGHMGLHNWEYVTRAR